MRLLAPMLTVPLDGRCTMLALNVGPLERRSRIPQVRPDFTVMCPSTVWLLRVRMYGTEQANAASTPNTISRKNASAKALRMEKLPGAVTPHPPAIIDPIRELGGSGLSAWN